MKKELIALSLFAGPLLFADGEGSAPIQNENGCCNTCYSTPCCCKPCCVPKPRPCIDCECYSPAFYDLQCDWGFSFDIEFLYWYAEETNLSYALRFNEIEALPGSAEIVFAPSKYKFIEAEWDPGFRVGIGYHSDCDGWDSYLTWTWMKNCATDSSSAPDRELINPWINQSFGTATTIRDFHSVNAKWRLAFNQIDWEIGRKYWNSRCFALRPYIALRGAWWKTQFNTLSKRISVAQGDSIRFRDQFTNRVWGVGFLGGLEPTWYFCSNFALYGNFDIALLWGKFEAKKREKYSGTIAGVPRFDYSNRAKGTFSQMTPMLDTAIGLRWEETWCCDRYRTALDLGWEHHVLLDQNHRMKVSDHSQDIEPGEVVIPNGFKTYDEATGNIGLGGFVLRLRFDF